MKRYQLIGRRKDFAKQNIKVSHAYTGAHICLLPLEIILQILQHFSSDIDTLLRLALVCRRFNIIVSRNFLYKSVKLNGSNDTFLQFYNAHMPPLSSFAKKFTTQQNSQATSKIHSIQELVIVKPPSKPSDRTKSTIAGSYHIEAAASRHQETDYEKFVKALHNIIKESYSITSIELTEISPNFAFHISNEYNFSSHSTGSFFQSFKRDKPRRVLNKLTLSAQSGWSIPFKLGNISMFFQVYEEINELELHNFIIDEIKLLSANGSFNKQMVVKSLKLVACTFVKRPYSVKKLPKESCDIFGQIQTLNLTRINSWNDLSIIDFIKVNGKLSKLILDLDSSIFFEFENDKKFFNFARYNLFFKLLCSGSGSYSTIKELQLANFSLLDKYGNPHFFAEPLLQNDEWVAPPTDTFNAFLVYLAPIPKLSIILKDRSYEETCTSCGSVKSSQSKSNVLMWQKIFKPIIVENGNCDLSVYDYDDKKLFSTSRS